MLERLIGPRGSWRRVALGELPGYILIFALSYLLMEVVGLEDYGVVGMVATVAVVFGVYLLVTLFQLRLHRTRRARAREGR